MRLILDFGNTYQKCAVFEKNELVAYKRFENIQLENIKTFTNKHPQIKSAILSSVINHKSDIISFLKESYFFLLPYRYISKKI